MLSKPSIKVVQRQRERAMWEWSAQRCVLSPTLGSCRHTCWPPPSAGRWPLLRPCGGVDLCGASAGGAPGPGAAQQPRGPGATADGQPGQQPGRCCGCCSHARPHPCPHPFPHPPAPTPAAGEQLGCSGSGSGRIGWRLPARPPPPHGPPPIPPHAATTRR